jgi:tetratricopeptide (TPR) repeat protein
MGDIHYTLQTWPNHHRALNSAFRYRLQHKELWASGDNSAQNYPAECYLQRAINFSPNDPIPYMLHGMLMHQMKKFDAALKSYREAIRLRPDDLVTQYNMGLTLVELKKYREAQEVADKVYAAEFPLPGLQRKLAEATKQKAKAQAAQAKAPDSADDAASQESVEKNAQASPGEVDNAQPPGSPPPAGNAIAADSPGKEPSKPASGDGTPASVENAAVKQGVAAEQSTTGDTTASKPAPKLTEEQLAILRQALKDQAAKKSKDAENAVP